MFCYDRPMRVLRSIALVTSLLAAALFSGCARSQITTEIKAGGAWTRTVSLTGQEKKEGGMDMGASLEDVFALPAGGEWKSREQKKDTDRTLIFERSFSPGGSLAGDLSIKGGEGDKPMLVNEVTVKSAGSGRFEYRETLRWGGPPAKNAGVNMKAEDLAQLKAALPKALATDENARAVADKAAALAVPMLFGPSDPLLALGMMHPDLAARRASQRIGTLMLKALEDQFGNKMRPEERREVTRKLIDTVFSMAKPAKPDPAAGPPSGKSTGLTPLMFVVKSGGKIISTNGERDEFTGEVYWALFPEAASLKPVVLTAVVQP
jgi:hypothetical protein